MNLSGEFNGFIFLSKDVDGGTCGSARRDCSTAAKWQKQGKKEKRKKKQKSLKRLGKTFWHARTKKCDKTGCYCMLSCLIFSSLDS